MEKEREQIKSKGREQLRREHGTVWHFAEILGGKMLQGEIV